jgi:hypothetical protein
VPAPLTWDATDRQVAVVDYLGFLLRSAAIREAALPIRQSGEW